MTSKVFGIGLSRTGTTTLNHVLNEWGWETVHYPNERQLWDPRSHGATDIPVALHFRELDLKFPGSKFVYTVRNKERWLDSIVPYIERKRQWKQSESQVNIRKQIYGSVFPNRNQADKAWDRHHGDVLGWFGNADRLLVIDIVGGEPPSKLADFLGVKTSMTEFPDMNRLKS